MRSVRVDSALVWDLDAPVAKQERSPGPTGILKRFVEVEDQGQEEDGMVWSKVVMWEGRQ